MSQRLFPGKNANFILPIVDTQHRLFGYSEAFSNMQTFISELYTKPALQTFGTYSTASLVAETAKLPSLHDLSPKSAIKSWCSYNALTAPEGVFKSLDIFESQVHLPDTIIKQRISIWNGKSQGGKVTIHLLYTNDKTIHNLSD